MRFSLVKGLWLMALVTVLVSCGGEDEPTVPNVPVTFLATGAQFDYYYTDFFFEDTVKTVVEEQIGQDTFLIRNYSEFVPVFPTQYWVLKGSTLYSSFRLRDPNSYVIECKFNKPKGTSWKVKKGSQTLTYTIAALNASISTGEGVVDDAVKIKITAPGSDAVYQYISPTVGPIGTGDFEDLSSSIRLVKYKEGTAGTTTNVIPAITYGDYPFLKVGNFWRYNEWTFFGEDVVTITVESKLANKNIYKVLASYETGENWYSYWYEDNGFLMVYEEGEEIVEADPIYVSNSIAEIGLGWGSLTESGQFFIYTVQELNETVETYFGNLSATGIYVSDGYFSSQMNYWTANKGNVLVTGFVERSVIDSNARKAGRKAPFVPIIGIGH